MFENIIDRIGAAGAESMPQRENDYKGKDGLLICGSCNAPKELRIKFFFGERVVRTMCECEKARDTAEKAAFQARQDEIETNRLRSVGVQDKKILSYTFENDDGRNPKVGDLARRYVEKFAEMKAHNCGLLFYGDTGGGKSYFAGCIGNALIDRGVSVLATSITRLLNQLFSAENKNALLRDLCRYDLLIIDDIGAERGTDYAIEQVYTVIDERYKSGKPTIFTTNATPQQLNAEADRDIKLRRIYDRIFEMSSPVFVEGQRRKEIGRTKTEKMHDILYGGKI